MNRAALSKPLYAPRSARKTTGKRRLTYLLLLILLALAGQLFAHCCAAETASDKRLDEVEKELQQNIEDNLAELDVSELENWLKELNGKYGTVGIEGVTSTIKDVIAGNFEGGFPQFTKQLTSAIGKSVGDVLPILIIVVAIAILYSLLEGLTSGFMTKQTKEIIYFVCYSAIIVVILVKIIGLIDITRTTVGLMKTLMEAAFPVLVTMITLLGGASTSAVFKPMMSVLATTITMIVTTVVLPLIIAVIVFGVVGNLSNQVKLNKMTKFFKSCAAVILGAVFSVFVTFLTLQGLTGGIADSISVKTAKFALQSYIPILGGYLSDGFDLMLASVMLIKNSFGLVTLIMMMGAILLPVIKIIVFSLGLKLVSGIIEPICDERMSKMTSALASHVTFLAVILIGVGFMFFITVMLSVYACNFGLA